MKLLETEWMSYRNAVIPRGAPSVQLTESRRAFYAGAAAFYSIVLNRMTPGSEPSDEDVALMRKLDQELKDFRRRVEVGQA